MAAAKRRAKKPVKKAVKRRVRKPKSVKDLPVTKLDFWAIAAKEVYDACRRAGMDEGNALAFAMDRSSYPDWIVDPKDPIKNPLDDFDEDEE